MAERLPNEMIWQEPAAAVLVCSPDMERLENCWLSRRPAAASTYLTRASWTPNPLLRLRRWDRLGRDRNRHLPLAARQLQHQQKQQNYGSSSVRKWSWPK